MPKLSRRILIFCLLAIIISSKAWAYGVPANIRQIRVGQSAERVRMVLDLDRLPHYKVSFDEKNLLLLIDIPATINKAQVLRTVFNDPFVDYYQVVEMAPGEQRIIIKLKAVTIYQVFELYSPNRLVINIVKNYEQKIEGKIAYGISHNVWRAAMSEGPVVANILTIDMAGGYEIKPVLAREKVQGLEPLSVLAARRQAIAAINASYFGSDGTIFGLIKIEGHIASVGNQPRSAVGIMPDGSVIMDVVNYQGRVELPNGNTLVINGINSKRNNDAIVAYNQYFGPSTGTNRYGAECVIRGDTVVAVYAQGGNTTIPPGCTVLSAQGRDAAEIQKLKIGDKVRIVHSLGPRWDNVLEAVGAGPTLVKNGKIFITTKSEDFGSDVAGGRAPRTAIGKTQTGKIVFVVVDGRSVYSIGMNLLELAVFMQKLGCVEAINLDGGGSSEMIIEGNMVNNPSDGRERNIGSALIVIPRPLAK